MSDLSSGFNIARILQGQTLGFTIFEIRLTDNCKQFVGLNFYGHATEVATLVWRGFVSRTLYGNEIGYK